MILVVPRESEGKSDRESLLGRKEKRRRSHADELGEERVQVDGAGRRRFLGEFDEELSHSTCVVEEVSEILDGRWVGRSRVRSSSLGRQGRKEYQYTGDGEKERRIELTKSRSLAHRFFRSSFFD